MRISGPGDSNTGLIVGMVVVSSVTAALAFVIVISLAVIIHLKASRVNESRENTYVYPIAVDHLLPAGIDDGITAERNEAYAANIVMEKNDAYNAAIVSVD